MTSSLELVPWGPETVAWVSSLEPQAAIEACRSGKATALGFSRHHNFLADDLSGFPLGESWVHGVVVTDPDVINYKRIFTATNLRMVTIAETKKEIDLSRLDALEWLSITDVGKATLPNSGDVLKDVTIRKYKSKSGDLSALSRFKSLRHIEIIQSSLSSLSGLPSVSKLESLKLSHCAALKDITVLEEGVSLRELAFDSSGKKIVNLNSIGLCINLRKLALCGMGEIPNLSFISGLKNLQSLVFFDTVVLDGNLQPITQLKEIRHVAFQDKKHYSHKKSEFPNRV